MDIIAPTDFLIFVLVVGARFLLPLLIPFYPLPAIILCLLTLEMKQVDVRRAGAGCLRSPANSKHRARV